MFLEILYLKGVSAFHTGDADRYVFLRQPWLYKDETNDANDKSPGRLLAVAESLALTCLRDLRIEDMDQDNDRLYRTSDQSSLIGMPSRVLPLLIQRFFAFSWAQIEVKTSG